MHQLKACDGFAWLDAGGLINCPTT